MGNWANALAELASLEVAGVNSHYGIDALPQAIRRAMLPALLVLPLATADGERFSPPSGETFAQLSFSGENLTRQYGVTHLLLIAPSESSLGLRHQLPPLIDAVDAYFDALASDLTLNGTLIKPPHVTVSAGVYRYGTTAFIGCAFRHTWTLEGA